MEFCGGHTHSFWDLLRVPSSRGESLLKLRVKGHDIRGIYSCLDCIDIAKKEEDKKVIFFSHKLLVLEGSKVFWSGRACPCPFILGTRKGCPYDPSAIF
ncbi:MAG: hypothetical protein ACK4OF_00660, partial [Aquificaceae bacterium]